CSREGVLRDCRHFDAILARGEYDSLLFDIPDRCALRGKRSESNPVNSPVESRDRERDGNMTRCLRSRIEPDIASQFRAPHASNGMAAHGTTRRARHGKLNGFDPNTNTHWM